jgi:predicted RNase H-like HicB family nuclease
MKKQKKVQKNLTLIYWKGNKYWLGKLLENPEIMSQGKTLRELIENIKDAYYQMTLDEVPADYRVKEISV